MSADRYGHGDTARAEEVGIWNENGKEPGSEKGKNNGLVGDKAGAVEWRRASEKHNYIQASDDEDDEANYENDHASTENIWIMVVGDDCIWVK